MLHVTNGSIAVSRLHDLGLSGHIIPWDDVLHEGPVRAGISDDQLRQDRAEFLGGNWDDGAGILRGLRARDEQLARAAVEDDEIVLWFEHDLYDQLHVIQILSQLTEVGSARRARVTAILADDYLTAQADEQLQSWFETRSFVSEGQWDAANVAWRAFRAADPTDLAHFEHQGAWRWLRAALRRHLQQFPSVQGGLSRTEVATLRVLADGPVALKTAFRGSNEAEEAFFMGDLGWWSHIRSLITGPQPLIAVVGEPPADFNHPEWWREDEAAPALALTDTGTRVLAGEADRVALNGINRWLGGVHLLALPGDGPTAVALWRWDEERQTLDRPSTQHRT